MTQSSDPPNLGTMNETPSMPDRASVIACDGRTEILRVSHQGKECAALTEPLRAFVEAAKAQSTRKAYRYDWKEFATFCEQRHAEVLPCAPRLLANYLSALAHRGRKVASIERALSSISQTHRVVDLPSPRSHALVRHTLQGIRRTLGVRQNKKRPITIAALRRILAATPQEGLRGARDRALLLVCFAGALRRSELVALNVEDICDDYSGKGLRVLLCRSKTDQEGLGREVGIPCGENMETCPVRALRAWTSAAKIKDGAVFVGVNRHGKTTGKRLAGEDVARVLKAYAKQTGLEVDKIAGHSLRAGLVTTAAGAGKAEHSIMRHTGHTSAETVRGYIRPMRLFEDNAAMGIGL